MNQTFARIRELEQELAEARQHISDGMHELSAEREQLRQLMDRRDAALDALRQVEWAVSFFDCPWCHGSSTIGHAPNCARQAALGQPVEPR